MCAHVQAKLRNRPAGIWVRFLVLCSLILTAPGRSFAAISDAPKAPELQDRLKDQARQEYLAGKEAYNQQRYDLAYVKFKTAHELSKDVGLLWNMAACELELKHYASALRLVNRYLMEGGALVTPSDIAEATQLITEHSRDVGKVELVVTEAGAAVLVDGLLADTTPLRAPILLDPGTHKIALTKTGFVTTTAMVNVTADHLTQVELHLEKTERQPPETTPIAVSHPPPLPPSPAPSPPLAPPHPPVLQGENLVRRGLYLHIASGLGGGSDRIVSPVQATVSGFAVSPLEFRVGGTLGGTLVLGGALSITSIVGPTYETAGTSMDYGSSISLTSVGPIFGCYPVSEAGLYVDAAAGIGYVSTSNNAVTSRGVSEQLASIGAALAVSVGYEHRLGPKWSIGPQIRLAYLDASDGFGVHHRVLTPLLQFGATYH